MTQRNNIFLVTTGRYVVKKCLNIVYQAFLQHVYFTSIVFKVKVCEDVR